MNSFRYHMRCSSCIWLQWFERHSLYWNPSKKMWTSEYVDLWCSVKLKIVWRCSLPKLNCVRYELRKKDTRYFPSFRKAPAKLSSVFLIDGSWQFLVVQALCDFLGSICIVRENCYILPWIQDKMHFLLDCPWEVAESTAVVQLLEKLITLLHWSKSLQNQMDKMYLFFGLVVSSLYFCGFCQPSYFVVQGSGT